MVFWVQLIISLVIYIIGALLNRPSLENAKATPFDEANFPDIDPRKKVPVGWGTARFTSPFICDIVSYRFVKLKKKVKTSPFTKKKVTIGYRYFVGMQIVLGRAGSGTTYALQKIFWEDDELYSGPAVAHSDTGNNFQIDEPDFLGGEEKGGGIVGLFRFYGGSTTQQVDTYVESFHGADEVPAYRNNAILILEDVEIGESPNMSPIQVTMTRIPNQLGLPSPTLNTFDINPTAFIADLFLNDDYGLGLPFAELDAAQFSAIATTLAAETPPMSMSLKWANNEAIKKLFGIVQEQMDGVVFFFNGEWTLLLTRLDYTVGALPVFDDDTNSKLIRFGRTDPSQVTNTVELVYQDRDLGRRPSPIFVQDSANFERAGRNKSIQVDYPALYDEDLANFAAGRELHSRGIALANVELEVNREAFNLKPSEPFVYVNPTLGIVQLVMRAVEIALGTPRNRTIRLRAIQDVFGIGASLITPPATEPPLVVGPPLVITELLIADLPYLFALVDEDLAVTIAGEQHKPIVWPVKPQGNALAFRFQLRIGADPFNNEEEFDYGPVGVLAANLVEGSLDTLPTLVINSVQEAGVLDTPLTLSEIQKLFNGHLMIFSSSPNGTGEPEILAYESFTVLGTTVTLVNVHRGMMDTQQEPALLGDRVAFHNGQATSITDTFASGQLVDTRHINLASSGDAAPSAVFPVQLRNRINRPFPAANFQVNAMRYPDSPVVIPPVAIIPTGDITLTWRDRDRTDASSFYQGDAAVAMEAGMEYRLEIYEEDGAPSLLRTETIAAGVETFVYTEAFILADGGPFEFYRLELRAHPTGTPTVNENITDVIRRIRYEGGITPEDAETSYRDFVIASADLDVYVPMTDLASAPGAQVIGQTLTAIRQGGIAPGAPSLTGDYNSRSFGVDGMAGSQLQLADSPTWDFVNGWRMNIWFCVGENVDDQVLILREQDAGSDDTIRVWVDTLGRVQTRFVDTLNVPTTFTTGIAPFLAERYDDGQPHFLSMRHFIGSDIIQHRIDGIFMGSSSVAIGSLRGGTEPLYLGGPGPSAFGVSCRGMVGHFSVYDDTDSGIGHRNHWRKGRRRHPFEQLVESLQLDAWWRLGPRGGIFFIFDWTENFGGTVATNSPVGRNASFLAGVQGNESYSPSMLWNGTTQRMSVGASTGFGSATFGGLGGFFNTNTAQSQAIIFGTGNAGTNEGIGVLVLSTGEVRLFVRVNGAGNQYFLTTTPTFADGLDHFVWVEKGTAGTVPTIWVDGVPYSNARGNATEALAGTGANTDWIAAVTTAAGGDGNMVWAIAARERAGSTDQFFDGRLAEIMVRLDVATPDADIVGMYAAARGRLRVASDVLLDEDIHHVFEIDDFAAIDDVMDNMNAVTAAWVNTGTGEDVAQVPLAMDDELASVRLPRNGTLANAIHAKFEERAFLESKGLQNFHDFGWFAQLMSEAAADGIFFANNDNALAALNVFGEYQTAATLKHDKFSPSNLWIESDDDTALRGRVFSVGVREEFIGGGSPPANMAVGLRALMIDRAEAAYQTIDVPSVGSNDPDLVEIAAATNMDDAYIAVWGGALTDNTRNFGGLMNRLAFWDRAVSKRRLLTNTLRSLGAHEGQRVIQSHEPTLYWRLNDEGSPPLAIIDFSKNGRAGQVFDPTDAHFDEAANRAENVWWDDCGVFRGDRVGAADGGYLGIDGVVAEMPTDLATYPFAVGGWFKPVDDASGSDVCLVFFGDDGSESRFSCVVRGTAAGTPDTIQVFTQNLGGSTDIFTTAVVPGGLGDLWSFIVFNFTTTTNCDVYLAGEFYESLTFTAVSGWTPDRFRVNAQEFNASLQQVNNANFHDIFVVEKEFTAAEVRELYAGFQRPAFDQLTEADAPIAFWKLNEHEVVDRLRNSIRDSSGHIIVGDATGLGTQGAAGIIPNYNDNAVDFDGTGQVDTNWQEYPTGSTNRTFEGWVENGFVGTWFSMGTNTDLQALVASIAANGDVTVNIRGAGETLVFTTTGINIGTPHLVALELDGTTLNSFRLWVDGVEITTTSGGSASVVNTVQTLDLFIGSDVTDIATADGTGTLSRLAVYDSALAESVLISHAAAGGLTV